LFNKITRLLQVLSHMIIHKATQPDTILHCFEAMHALRPHLRKETFVVKIQELMKQGYHLVFTEDKNKAVAVAGYRFTELLAWGKAIYIDDLGTLPEARGKGHASALLDYIIKLAKENGCAQVHLDSGAVPARYDAHRLYLKKGFNITSHHFAYIL